MRIFLDTANVTELREGAAMGLVDMGLKKFLDDWNKPGATI